MATASDSACDIAAPVLFDIDDPRWRSFVEAQRDVRPVHDPAWAQVLSATYGYRALGFGLLGARGELRSGVPLIEVSRPFSVRRWVSLPFTDTCPPLLARGESATSLLLALEQARRDSGISAVEIRAPLDSPAHAVETDAVVHELELCPDPDEIFARFHRSQVQRNIRRAEREGVRVETARTEAEVTEIYYRLHAATRRRLGVPAQPRRFFAHLWREMLAREGGFVLLAYVGARPVAGAVFLSLGRSVFYKYGASNPAFWSHRPNHLIFWTAIRTACESGYETFDFGRTDRVDTGLREFKKGWGAREDNLVYSVLAARAPSGARTQVPDLARTVIRHSPTWMCRAAGEVLYRFAA